MDAKKVTRVIACAGKVYFDLINARRERKLENIAILRVEQLYPFDDKRFDAELKKFPNAPRNWCGARKSPQPGCLVRQDPSPASSPQEGHEPACGGPSGGRRPGCGYLAKHNEQQKTLIDTALGKLQ